MKGGLAAARVLVCLAVTLLVIALSPVIVLVGEPLRRYCLRRLSRAPSRSDGRSGLPRRHGAALRRRGLARTVIANPLLIALTAPARWVIDRAGSVRFGGSGGRDGRTPPPAGVREPRRPKPGPPAGAIALAEPRQQLRLRIRKSLLTILSRQARRPGSWLRRQASMPRARVSRRVRGWAG